MGLAISFPCGSVVIPTKAVINVGTVFWIISVEVNSGSIGSSPNVSVVGFFFVVSLLINDQQSMLSVEVL